MPTPGAPTGLTCPMCQRGASRTSPTIKAELQSLRAEAISWQNTSNRETAARIKAEAERAAALAENKRLRVLPMYASNASPEEREKKLEFMAYQVAVIKEQQSIGVPAKHVKIRCGCNRFIPWMNMFRCLYCGIYYCMDCAEIHFGKKKPNVLTNNVAELT
jgi:hypothetical protein